MDYFNRLQPLLQNLRRLYLIRQNFDKVQPIVLDSIILISADFNYKNEDDGIYSKWNLNEIVDHLVGDDVCGNKNFSGILQQHLNYLKPFLVNGVVHTKKDTLISIIEKVFNEDVKEK